MIINTEQGCPLPLVVSTECDGCIWMGKNCLFNGMTKTEMKKILVMHRRVVALECKKRQIKNSLEIAKYDLNFNKRYFMDNAEYRLNGSESANVRKK